VVGAISQLSPARVKQSTATRAAASVAMPWYQCVGWTMSPSSVSPGEMPSQPARPSGRAPHAPGAHRSVDGRRSRFRSRAPATGRSTRVAGVLPATAVSARGRHERGAPAGCASRSRSRGPTRSPGEARGAHSRVPRHHGTAGSVDLIVLALGRGHLEINPGWIWRTQVDKGHRCVGILGPARALFGSHPVRERHH